MRKFVTVLSFCLTLCWLLAMEVPFSKDKLLLDENQSGEFIRIDPLDYQPDTLKTKAWLWQDDKARYVSFESVIDESFNVGPNRGRDSWNQSDFVRIQLITIPEAFYAYMYYALPNGALYDAVRSHSLGLDTSWNSSYEYETTHNDSLWQVQMKIPLGELRYPQKLPYQWKVIFTRYNNSKEEYFSFPPRETQEGKDYYLKAEDIILHHKVPRLVDLKLKPYFVKSYDLITKTDSFDPENVGLDIALNPGSRTKIKISLNPDFSDAPIDGAMDVYNSKYPPYFSENRFFFTEDLDAFSVEPAVFYTRNIVQPQMAFKLTGNMKSVNYGVLGAWDKEQKSGDYTITESDYYQVVSLIPTTKKMTFKNALISRMNSNYYNHVYSGDLKLNVYKDFYVNSVVMASTRYQEQAEDNINNGFISSLVLSYDSKKTDFSIYGTKISKDFTADAGYINNADLQKWGNSFSWDSGPKDSYLKYWGCGYWNEYYMLDPDGEKNIESSNGANLYFNFKPKYNISFNGNYSNALDLRNTNHITSNLSMNSGFWRWDAFNIYLYLSYGKTLVYSLNDTRDRFTGTLNFSGDFYRVFSYSLSLQHTAYDYPKTNVITVGFEEQSVYLDNQYQIFNASLYYNPNPSVRVSNGMGISFYETGSSYQNLSNYGNLRYEFRKDCFLYMGYQTRQIQEEKPLYSNPLGHYRKASASAYLKIAFTI